MRDYIGFYWTLPVPWAGHQTLPQDVDEAALKSLTIRYQRECARQWVKENKGQLIDERVFMELAPDRGTEHIVPEVERALKRCREVGACLLVVDMAASYGWRSHPHLDEVLHDNEEDCERLYPSEIMIDGHRFDPVEHFRKWREAQHAFSEIKAERMARAKEAAEALFPSHSNLASLAEALNAEGHRTASGKLWSKDSLRKTLLAVGKITP
jgi:hypothetical protein